LRVGPKKKHIVLSFGFFFSKYEGKWESFRRGKEGKQKKIVIWEVYMEYEVENIQNHQRGKV
jgi:hypothetical protein